MTSQGTPQPPENTPDSQGVGGEERRGESGLSKIQDARLTARAVRQGWFGNVRWPTHVTKSELVKLFESRGELTAQEKALYTVIQNMDSADPRFQLIAAKTVVSMEKQNQDDEHKQIGDTVEHNHHIDISAIMEAMLSERENLDYLDSLRSSALQDDRDAGAVCQNGEPGHVENGETSGLPGPKTNGDSG